MPHPPSLQRQLLRVARSTGKQRRLHRLNSHQFRGLMTLEAPHEQRLQVSNAQSSLPAAYYRGGTSRALFFRRKDLPEDKSQWDGIFLGTIGSPDRYGRQLDGMGGGISSLSKVCVVEPSDDSDVDVDYTFVSIGIKDTSVDYSSNCGNMSAAVGPFAINSGMVEVPRGATSTTIRIRNTNTEKMINATFPVVNGEAAASGDYSIDGVSGTAARVQLDFVGPGGSRTGKLLPTGNTTDRVAGVRATLIDVGNPCCFVLASDLGIPGTLSSQQIDEDDSLKKRLEAIRLEAAVKMGLATSIYDVAGSVPKIGFVSQPHSRSDGDVTIRAMSVGQPHKAIPVTVALAVAAAAKITGSTIEQCLIKPRDDSDLGIDINHASGKLNVDATYDSQGHLEVATVFRTARRLMEGRVFWK
ncbi:PrpF protein [Hypomontagnella monticulosa]|nr:PrpF protein [Hypomontagnella monticulosa]